MMERDDATLRQIAAAQPDRSTWLGANAGSGKTRVLTDRVARLLLNGVDPQHILCLTYTKAAASEMQNRLFARLGEWAMLDSPSLGNALRELGVDGTMDDAALRDARRLFARAIEAPGGLRIQTIHSFCASLLRRFPLEAGVSPQFVEMEERTAKLLRAEIIEEIAAGPHAAKLNALARFHTGETLDELTQDIVRHAPMLSTPWTEAGLANALGLRPDVTARSIEKEVFLGGETALLSLLVTELSAGTDTDFKAADKLRRLSVLDYSALQTLEDVFLSKGGKAPFTVKSYPPTKNVRGALGDTMDLIDAWRHRVEAARPKRVALEAVRLATALQDFSQVFLPAYAKAKQLRGWLDFDDLILRANALLTRSDVAAWVLFRLDGGIDHILVDEAQDTSPVQWQVIDRLAQEFTAGEGARQNVQRTLFVVGDKKQSIYSFQGADPREFDRMQSDWADRLEAAGTPLQSQRLEHSFRSSSAVLDAVDAVFRPLSESGFAPDQRHIAFHKDMPGRVDLWPINPEPDKEDPPLWHDPVDIRAKDDPNVVLAAQIADHIARMIEDGQPIPDKGGMRPVRAGDVLILVQSRGPIFHEIIGACKSRGLPIAGADRLKVGAELAVKDLAALLSFLATPEDDLSLAVALRSPLLGWDEGALYDLAHKRHEKYLWQALRARGEEFPETMAVLADLRDQADFLRPYDLIERILTRHDGRRRMLARLGPEAEDGIDALLSQALAYEQRAVDSLTGFLIWLETDALEIKRQVDAGGDLIRVMTVHGAKGLEAPIVILPDTGTRKNEVKAQILDVGGAPVWKAKSAVMPDAQGAVIERMKAAQSAERDRLLYVAMTRAEKWLIVASANKPGDKGETWYEKIEAGLTDLDALPYPVHGATGLRLERGDWTGPDRVAAPDNAPSLPPLPAFFHTHAPAMDKDAPARTPSDLGGAKALFGEIDTDQDEEAAKLRGTHIHSLLEFLPALPSGDRADIAARLLPDAPDLTDLLAEANRNIEAPALAQLWTATALPEVGITADLPELGRFQGVIDRLILTDDTALIVDFKSNALVPATAEACPEGLLRQMGAYAAMAALVYPDRRIETAILWTRTATLMRLPHDLVTSALARAAAT
ncbi:DNA helicase/exodeoxyribonuclease V, subunit A [Roseovarius nanhaiticus]|uniref:DNA 3'-5' helicase n=1 Tax=Roseovarius nanhaiticus TaxID=573024 RepID=A0A1N7EHV4_9RHOB|nr:double-strand break repair helicase AddA [Roseovarius nanhaiticus]SEK74315.1 DNA helicase/exodeoxyribonuclease V, subunit A [Roseovarius nanhaiticus]SIR87640.1 DNA helicase/exodeoxyribonuclease V, subunit A [Roseovarius nanhaiticus]